MSRNHPSRFTSGLGLAGQVQQLLFPNSSPGSSWCCSGFKNRMAQEIGGNHQQVDQHCQSDRNDENMTAISFNLHHPFAAAE